MLATLFFCTAMPMGMWGVPLANVFAAHGRGHLVPWVLALPFYGLEMLVGFVQALIFSGLTLVFVTMGVAPHEHEPEVNH